MRLAKYVTWVHVSLLECRVTNVGPFANNIICSNVAYPLYLLVPRVFGAQDMPSVINILEITTITPDL